MAMKQGEPTTAITTPQVFTHEQFGEVRVRYDDYNIEVNLEDATRGLGFVQAKKDRVPTSGDNPYTAVRWERVSHYLEEIGYEGEVNKDAYIPEAVFYMLAMKATNEAAKKFQRWIAYEVVPNIRKHGFYITPSAKITPNFLRQLASTLEAKNNIIAAQEIQIAELTQKANYYDKVLNCSELLTTTDIAKDYRMSAVKFNQLLARLGIQFRRGDRWYLYQKYARLGWSSTRTYLKNGKLIAAKTHMCWTQAGKRGLYNLLKEYGYRPATEQPSLFDFE